MPPAEEPALPPPPPAPAARGDPKAAKLAAMAVFAAVFGRSLSRAGAPDWAAAGFFGAAAAAYFFGRCGWRAALRLPAGLLAFVAMAAAFYRYGAGCFVLPSEIPDLEVLAPAGLGLAAAGASLYLGLWEAQARDRALARRLAAASAGLLFLAACSWRLPPGARWPVGIRAVLESDWRTFAASGGPWRWGGLLVLCLAWRLLRRRAARPAQAAKGPILDWYR